jgi:xanthine dehydrogenase accessory factor
MPCFFDFLPEALAESQPFALGIISRVKGSSPQKKGAKALFLADGRIKGTLGGGCLEAEIQDRARRALRTGEPATFELVLDHDFGWDDGLICGGKVCGLILPRAAEAAAIWSKLGNCDAPVTWGVRDDFTIALDEGNAVQGWLYRETVAPPCALWIAGSGHVAQAVAPIAVQLDFQVTVFDDRPALANSKHFPPTTQFRVEAWEKLMRDSLPPRPTFGLIVTRGHQHDALVLREWIQRPFESDHLATAEQLARVACPVGIDIDATSVSEIAVSIVAQLVQERAAVLARVEREAIDLSGACATPA